MSKFQKKRRRTNLRETQVASSRVNRRPWELGQAGSVLEDSRRWVSNLGGEQQQGPLSSGCRPVWLSGEEPWELQAAGLRLSFTLLSPPHPQDPPNLP